MGAWKGADNMEFHEKLMQLRKSKGWSQEELGEQLDVTRQTVSKWELGTTTPEMGKLLELSRLFEISIDELTGNDAFAKATASTDSDPPRKRKLTYEYKSRRMVGKLPLVHIHFGLKPCVAKGIFAIGNIAVGICSLGLVSAGVLTLGLATAGLLALGAFSAGIITFGGISAGILAFGGIALGVMAVGGLACGVYSLGGLALASQIAIGGYAHAPVAIGDVAEGAHPFCITENDVTYAQVETAIAQECPNTPDAIRQIVQIVIESE